MHREREEEGHNAVRKKVFIYRRVSACEKERGRELDEVQVPAKEKTEAGTSVVLHFFEFLC